MVQNPIDVAEVYVTVTTPEELLEPAAGLMVPQSPVPTKPTRSPETGALVELITVAVIVDVEVPLSVSDVGFAATVTELLVLGAVVVITVAVEWVLFAASSATTEHVPGVEPAV